jgi:hypothetical protein
VIASPNNVPAPAPVVSTVSVTANDPSGLISTKLPSRPFASKILPFGATTNPSGSLIAPFAATVMRIPALVLRSRAIGIAAMLRFGQDFILAISNRDNACPRVLDCFKLGSGQHGNGVFQFVYYWVDTNVKCEPVSLRSGTRLFISILETLK